MQDLLVFLSSQSPFLAAVAIVVTPFVIGSKALVVFLTSLRQVGEEWRLIRQADGYNRLICRLYGIFIWPAFSFRQKRRKQRTKPVDALMLFFGGLLGLTLYVVVAISLVYLGEGLRRPIEHSLAGLAYLSVTVVFTRPSMIGAVKHWYGIR